MTNDVGRHACCSLHTGTRSCSRLWGHSGTSCAIIISANCSTETNQPTRMEHLFCSVPTLNSRRLWEQVGSDFYDFIIIDEAHHGTAASYRPIFDHFQPEILLGLTATPERMDGGSVVADFGNRFAAEIRLPEALEEKLLCPFHYFGVADPVSLDQDKFWKNGKYDRAELDNIYTGAHALARQRLDAIIEALDRFEPVRNSIKGFGFCVSIHHANYMADMFTERGIPSAALVSSVEEQTAVRFIRPIPGRSTDVPVYGRPVE